MHRWLIQYLIDCFNFVMNNLAILVVNECKHLGNVISNKNLINNSINIIKDMNVKTNVILSEFYTIDSLSRGHLFNSQCMNLYGCELINTNNQNEIDDLCINWRKGCRRVMNFSARTHGTLINTT